MTAKRSAAERREQVQASGLWIALLAGAATALGAAGAAGHLPQAVVDMTRLAWTGALLTSGATLSSVLSRVVALPVGVALCAAALARMWQTSDGPADGSGGRALAVLAAAAAATGAGLVLGPALHHLRRVLDARHPAPGSWQKVGLSAPPLDGDTLPLRWTTGALGVTLADAGPRSIQVVKVLGDLAPDGARRHLLRLGRPGGPPLPLTVASGLSTEDAHRVATRLRDAGAGVEVG